MSSQAEVRLWVALVWQDALLCERTVRPGEAIRIGSGPGDVLPAPPDAGVGADHLLFGDGSVHLSFGMTGHLSRDGRRIPLDAWRAAEGPSPTLRPGDRGVLEMGSLAVVFEMTGAAARVPPSPVLSRWDSSFLGTLNAAVVLHVGLLIGAFLLESGDAEARPEPVEAPRFVRVDATPFQAPAPEPEPERPAAGVDGEAGTLGRPELDRETQVARRDGADTDRPRRATALDTLDRVAVAGGPLGDVFARDPDFGARLTAAVGEASGDVVGRGTHGFSIRGTGDGGGGRIGRIGGFGDPGIGGGGRPVAQVRRPGPRRPPPSKIEVRESTGFCKESDILRVVRARRLGVSHCYERALMANPELRGKLTLRWTIALDGSVLNTYVSEDTLRSADVSGCVRRAVQRWRFAKPDGGQCVVQFPFVFDPGA